MHRVSQENVYIFQSWGGGWIINRKLLITSAVNPSISNARPRRKIKVGLRFSFDTRVGIEENLVLAKEVA